MQTLAYNFSRYCPAPSMFVKMSVKSYFVFRIDTLPA